MAKEQKPKQWYWSATQIKKRFTSSSPTSGQQATSNSSHVLLPPTQAKTNARDIPQTALDGAAKLPPDETTSSTKAQNRGKDDETQVGDRKSSIVKEVAEAVTADDKLEKIAVKDKSISAGSEPKPGSGISKAVKKTVNSTQEAASAAQTRQSPKPEEVVHGIQHDSSIPRSGHPMPSLSTHLKAESSLRGAVELPDPTEAPWYHSRTPEWNAAVKAWKAKSPAQFEEMQNMVKANNAQSISGLDSLFHLPHGKEISSEKRTRLKRWQNPLASARGIAMTAANFDPNKIAPIVCASVLFGVDILFNSMNPEDRDKILDVLCQCGTVIKEGISFEMSFTNRSHPAANSQVDNMNTVLREQYGLALQLVYAIRRSCRRARRELKDHEASLSEEQRVEQNLHDGFDSMKKKTAAFLDDRLRNLSRKVTNEVLAWESNAKAIARLKTDWSTEKKSLEDAVVYDRNTVTVRNWIREKLDPEPTWEDLKNRITPHGRYQNAGEWFLKGEAFKTWCTTFQPASIAHVEDPPPAQGRLSKRVLWLRGGFGTGKTAVLYHASQLLKYDTVVQPVGRELRVIPYFCDASKAGTERPTFATVLRAITSVASVQPDHSLSPRAQKLYDDRNSSRSPNEGIDIEEVKKLLNSLLGDHAEDTHFVFVVDALDECKTSSDHTLFLKFMSSFMTTNHNVSLLCSSHQHVPVARYFGVQNRYYGEGTDYFGADILQDVEVTEAATAEDMRAYVEGELRAREKDADESIFYRKDTPVQAELLEELRVTLIKHANGMFKWVSVWLDIMIPGPEVPNFDEITVWQEQDARDLLKQMKADGTKYGNDQYKLLEAGWKRLWDLRARMDGSGVRNRLFHFVLAALEPLTTESLTEYLRPHGKNYDTNITTEQVSGLYANFLVEETAALREDRPGEQLAQLRFVHASAQSFVLRLKKPAKDDTANGGEKQFSSKENHLSFVKLYTDVIGCADHRYWEHIGVVPKNWKHYGQNTEQAKRLDADLRLLMATFPPVPRTHRILHTWKKGITRLSMEDEVSQRLELLRASLKDELPITVASAPLYSYLMRRGLEHCDRASEEDTHHARHDILAEQPHQPTSDEVVEGRYLDTKQKEKRRSIHDKVWRDILNRVILNPSSAFGTTLLIMDHFLYAQGKFDLVGVVDAPSEWRFVGALSCLRQTDEGLELLASHIIVYLRLISGEDLITPTPIQVDPQRLDGNALLKNASCIGGGVSISPWILDPDDASSKATASSATALQIACELKDEPIVRAVLMAAKTRSQSELLALVTKRSSDLRYPINQAIASRSRSVDVAQTLLETEVGTSRPQDDAVTTSYRPPVSTQWSLSASPGRPALHVAIESLLKEAELRHLLQVALPADINMVNDQGQTPLHLAVRLGLDGLARDLVELYGADINALDGKNRPTGYGDARTSYRKVGSRRVQLRGIEGDFIDVELWQGEKELMKQS